MKKLFYSGSFILLFVFQLTAQETSTVNIKKIDVCEVYVSSGFNAQYNQYASVSDYKKLAPESQLLRADLTAFTKTESQSYTTGGMFSVLMGMRFAQKDRRDYKSNPIFRAGFSYFNTTSLTSDLYHSAGKPFDTLVSSQTGATYVVDSVNNRSYSMKYTSQDIRLDLSIIFRTDRKARWSFYSGIGINGGASLNAFTDIQYSNYPVIKSNNQYFYPSNTGTYTPNWKTMFYFNSGINPTGGTTETETFRNSNNIAFSAYVPLAVDFRMGNRREFWKRTHLFLEFRPGINFTDIPELGMVNTAFFQTNFGLKVNWENL